MRPRWASTSCSMPWRTSLRLLLLLVAGQPAGAAAPGCWPLQPDPATLRQQLAATRDLPAALQPAVQFQQSFAAIIAGAPVATWRADVEKIAQLTGDDPVVRGVREVARVWLARAAMQDLDGVLQHYYRHHVGFPDSLAAVANELPENGRVDPWGQPWVYAPHAPRGFARQTNQRYTVGPTRFPRLTGWREAIAPRAPPRAPWKITARDVAGHKALEFQGDVSALIQPGGMVGGFTLLFIGDGWALLAGLDQLFTLTY